MIWSACLEVGVKPPGVKDRWESMDALTQADVIAFHQTAEHVRSKTGFPRF